MDGGRRRERADDARADGEHAQGRVERRVPQVPLPFLIIHVRVHSDLPWHTGYPSRQIVQ